MLCSDTICLFFFFNDTATTEIYTLSLHDALPIWLFFRQRVDKLSLGHALQRLGNARKGRSQAAAVVPEPQTQHAQHRGDRKSTRLNSSHSQISYAVFCLKKKNIALRRLTSRMVSD